MAKVLIIVTNHATLGDTDEKNGTYAPELTHALQVFLDAGYSYDIASISGGAAPLYGEEIDDAVNQSVLADADFQARINDTLATAQINNDDYNALFFPGGFGLLSDLASNKDVAAITANFYEAGKVVAAVCHGPAALLPVELSDGSMLLASRQVTAFTREEEIDFATIDKIPFLLEEALTRKAAKFTKVGPWLEHVITDGQLVTGQNPSSAHAVGEAMVALIAKG
ncbi:type 1 glutamine amidotransferase domain-containing protein [Oceanicoccus sagamiensis]|uniref:Type 1 glutamine amidotransferase domain-containing protein n=1 Tax=Oceanicoccus sagamiensis TaxID=716816 RepID=A0A1X9N468_9GAMM|nr:type 1 glutamine amidotransferase domain-containing protein [Oceanicoccus sagamiensis]ARN72950.1 type 1 glutamine amidotransferase domain-containing protein [Oceanicoccus sagamiensis]